jgi:hypothetical protein
MLLLALAVPAASRATDGAVEGLVVTPGFTQGSLQNIHIEFDECGSAHELTCTWEVRATVQSAPNNDCDPNAPTATVWSSGEQSGNGSIDSGPQSFPLLGCKGQVLRVTYEFHKTYGNWGDEPTPVLIITGGGGTVTLAHLGYEPLAEAEQQVLDASKHPGLIPMPTPFASPRPLRASRDCRSLYAGDKRYAFRFKRIGCWKATRLVARSWSGTSPSGYRCSFARDGNSARCTSTSDVRKFYAWHPPRKAR